VRRRRQTSIKRADPDPLVWICRNLIAIKTDTLRPPPNELQNSGPFEWHIRTAFKSTRQRPKQQGITPQHRSDAYLQFNKYQGAASRERYNLARRARALTVAGRVHVLCGAPPLSQW
jgi:hypothetical protein